MSSHPTSGGVSACLNKHRANVRRWSGRSRDRAGFAGDARRIRSHLNRTVVIAMASAKARFDVQDDSFEARETRTPHSGFHWDGTDRTFFEGWYFKVTIPERPGCSFAFIYSVEDPASDSPRSAACCQVMGPSDGYIVQWDRNVDSFWGSRHALELGNTFATKPGQQAPEGILTEDRWWSTVEEGWQVGPRIHSGAIRATAAPGDLDSTVQTCRWSYTTKPVSGWGGTTAGQQRATAGWLAAFPVFEPHWQVCMSHGLASGWVEWGGERIEFTDAPAYAEKNWGGAFPEKWFWVQCNSFAGFPSLALTTGGGRRGLLGLPGVKEDVAMVGVHVGGQYLAVYPWQEGASVSWRVTPWGSWEVRGQNRDVVITVEALCNDQDGTLLRAPTLEEGMVPFCRDTFRGRVRLWVQRVDAETGRLGEMVVDGAESDSGALEVGGGPWWGPWEEEAVMKEPLKSLVQLPVEEITAPVNPMVPWILKPPGL